MSTHLTAEDLDALRTCEECNGTRTVPDIFGDYVLCEACSVLPRDPFI